jgi:hypothetical protein
MRAGPADAVHAPAAPEMSARVTQPVCAVPAPRRIGLLTVLRGGTPNPSRSTADGPDQAPVSMRANFAAAVDGPGRWRRYRLKTLHP